MADCIIESIVEGLMSKSSVMKNEQVIEFVDKLRGYKYVVAPPSIQLSLNKGVSEKARQNITMGSMGGIDGYSLRALPEDIKELQDQGKIQLLSVDQVIDKLKLKPKDLNFSIVGSSSRKARALGLDKATSMLVENVNPAKVLADTGWYLGNDGKFRYKLKTEPKAKPQLETARMGKTYLLKDLVDYRELFEQYPGLSMLKVSFTKPRPNKQGMYIPDEGRIEVVTDINFGMTGTHNIKEVMDTIGHEVQHAIQDIEKFAAGGSTKAVKSMDVFKRLTDIAAVFEGSRDKIAKHPAFVTEFHKIVAPLVGKEKDSKEAKEGVSKTKELIYSTFIAVSKDKDEARKFIASVRDDDAKYDLIKGNENAIAYLVYFNLLGEVEAREAGAYWAGETFDASQFDNHVIPSTKIPYLAIQGFYDPEDKIAYLNEDVLTEENLAGVVYHEVGVHMFSDVINERKDLGDRASKILTLGLNSKTKTTKDFFTRVHKRLEESSNVGNKEETLAYMVEEGFNTLEDHSLFNPSDRLDTALSKMRKILPSGVVDLIAKVIEAFIGNMKSITKTDVEKVKTAAKGSLSGLIYDLNLQAEYNDIISIVKDGVTELANLDKVDEVKEEMDMMSKVRMLVAMAEKEKNNEAEGDTIDKNNSFEPLSKNYFSDATLDVVNSLDVIKC